MEVIRKLIPLDVWAAIMTAIVAAVSAVVFRQAPFFVFLAVALALCVYIAKTLSETGPRSTPMSERTMQRLSQELCAQKAAECRRLAEQASKQSHRIMLESIAETWERISNSLTELA